jgi:outer membrane receptor protein involved in Fe transport
MIGSFRRSLLATTLLAGAAVSGPAFAQGATQAPVCPPGTPAGTNGCVAPDTAAAQSQTPVAQTTQTAAEPTAGETIVVTGSRIVSPNITSLAPVQVVGEQDIDKAGAVNVQEVLLENPSLGTPLLSTTNSAFLTSGAGSATIDLRDFGTNRTLVLINGRRVVGGVPISANVDLNVIPTQFIERIDILTGGASSLYGSDAVAGVVNFIYKRNFEGLQLEGQYGITEKGDWPRYQISATAGANFADDRGNVMIHLGYSDDKGLLSRQRKNTRVDDLSAFFLYYDPAQYFTEYEPYFSSFPVQGRFDVNGTSTNKDDFTFGPTGVLQPCFTTNGSGCSNARGSGTGPNGFNRQFFRTLSTPVKRWLFAERAHFDLTDNISFITEVTYSKTKAHTDIEPVPLDVAQIFKATARAPVQSVIQGPGGPVTVLNPFIPAAMIPFLADRDGDGLFDIGFSRRLAEFGTRSYDAHRHFFRIVAGFEGKLFNDRWNWDLTYNFGRSEDQQISTGDINIQNFQNAFQAVQETAATGDLNGNGVLGDIVCASAEARAEGCVPINLFGAGSAAPAAVTYVAADIDQSNRMTQQVVNANLSGSLIDLPAGPLGLAIGAEYRKEQGEQNWDALTNLGLHQGNSAPDTSGEFNVKEAYAEVNVPVLKDLPFAKQLNLRAAGRISDYSTVGTTKTWNVGGDYAPIDDIRFRATYAKAVRAPNIGELFTGPSQTFPTGLVDPCNGVTLTSTGTTAAQCLADPGVVANITTNGKFVQTQADKQGISGFLSGNPNLGPEKAKSLTAGVVINPKSIAPLRNLVLSVDYFHIKLTNAITLPAAQSTINLCYNQANAAACSFITRFQVPTGSSSAGALRFVNSAAINAAVQNTSGIDTVLQYRTSLDSLMSGLSANARISWTHYFKGYIIALPGDTKNPYVGEVGTSRNKANGTIAFNTRKVGVSFTGTYIGKALEDDRFIDAANVTRARFGLGPPLAHDAIVIPAEFYLDSQVSFTPIRNYEFYVGVDNLLDNKAPNLLSSTTFNNTGSDTAAAVYDIFGRRYYAGVRLKF